MFIFDVNKLITMLSLVHDVHPYTSDMFNTTHVIKHLSFGKKLLDEPLIEGIQIHPLDGHVGMAEDGNT